MKKLCYAISAFALFGIITFALASAATSSLVEETENFFTALKDPNKDLSPLLSTEFKDTVSAEAFNNLIIRFGLNKVTSTSWNERSVENSLGKIKGEVTIDDGRVIPVALEFIKQQDSWKLLAIDIVRPGLISDPAKLSLPASSDQSALATESIRSFAQAVKAKNFEQFYQTISRSWKINSTPESFKNAFQPLLDKNLDLTILNNHKVKILESTEINSEGVLVLQGHFPTAGKEDLKFTLRFVNEFNRWKLYGLNVLPVSEEKGS